MNKRRGKGKMIPLDADMFQGSSSKDQSKTSEKDINFKKPQAAEVKKASQPAIEVNKNEEEVTRFIQHSTIEFTVPHIYYALDNKLIDTYYANRVDIFTDEEKDLLTADEFLHYVSLVNKDLQYILDLSFTQFWGLMAKTPEVSKFLDEFLQNMRKHNDIFKIQYLYQYGSALLSTKTQPSGDQLVQEQMRQQVNNMLNLVLKVFFRLSLTIESDDEYLSVAFYSKIVYENWIFDMAKLIDLAAVYGKSNASIVQKIILNVFDNEKKFVQDFKESVDLLMGLMKTKFKEYSKVKDMITGDYITTAQTHEKESMIVKYLNDYIEVLNNFAMICSHFPESIIEIMKSTNALLFLANSYCLTIQLKKDIVNIFGMSLPKIERDQQFTKAQQANTSYTIANQINILKKLCIQSTLSIVKRVLVQCIGTHVKNFAIVQNQIALMIKSFVLSLTGNTEVNKDAFQKQYNYICSDGKSNGIPFLKKILNKVDLYTAVDAIEERFLPDGDKPLVLMVLESLSKGQKIQVQKIKAVKQQHQSQQAAGKGSELKIQDKENINTIFEMFNKEHSKQLIENIYLKNDKNFEVTLDQFLNNKIPKDEYKIVRIEESKNEFIETSSKSLIQPAYKKEKSDLLKQYVLGQFDGATSSSRRNKNKMYYEEHLRAMEQKDEEETDEKDLKKKMLHLANMMQYEDDFDDQNFYANNNNRKNNRKQSSSSSDSEKPVKKPNEDDDEDEANLDIVGIIERHESDQAVKGGNDYLFQEDDEKKIKKQQTQKKQEAAAEAQKKYYQPKGKDEHNRGATTENQRGGGQRGGGERQGNQDRGGQTERPQQSERGGHQDRYQDKGGRGGYPDREDRSGRGGYQDRGGSRGYQDRAGRGGQRGEQRGNRGGDCYRGSNRGGGDQQTSGKGRGYSDNYQRQENDRDNYYTSNNPLEGHNLDNNYETFHPRSEMTSQQNFHPQYQPKTQPQQHNSYNNDNYGDEDGEQSNGSGRGRGGGDFRGGDRGRRGRGGRGTNRGGFHDQKGKSFKKTGGF